MNAFIYLGIAVLFFILLIYIWSTVRDSITSLLQEKRNYYASQEASLLIANQLKTGERPHDMSVRLQSTFDLLDIIDGVVDGYILTKFHSLIMLQQPYDLKMLPDDIKLISKSTMDAIRPDVFENKDMMLTDTYLMHFITSTVTRKLLQSAQAHNIAIREA